MYTKRLAGTRFPLTARESRELLPILPPPLIERLPNEHVVESVLGDLLERVIRDVPVQKHAVRLAIPVEAYLRNVKLHSPQYDLIARELQLLQQPHVLLGAVQRGVFKAKLDFCA